MRRIGAWQGVAGRGRIDEAQVFRLLEVRRKKGGEGGLSWGDGLTDDVKVMVKVSAGRIEGGGRRKGRGGVWLGLTLRSLCRQPTNWCPRHADCSLQRE